MVVWANKAMEPHLATRLRITPRRNLHHSGGVAAISPMAAVTGATEGLGRS